MPGPGDLFRRRAVDAQNVMHGKVRIAPPPGWMATNVLITSLAAGAIIFASLANYSRTVTVEGLVETDKGVPTVVSNASGTVITKVELSQEVSAGEVIADVQINKTDDRGDQAERVRLAVDREIKAAQSRADAAINAGKSRAEAARIRARSASNQINSLTSQLKEARSRTKAAEADLGRARQIAERGFLSQRDLEQRESEVASYRLNESAIEERIAIARGEEASARAEAMQAVSQSKADQAEAFEAVSRAQRTNADDITSLTSVSVAPMSGKVAALPVKTGQAIEKGETIAVIMPDNAVLTARFEVPSRAMGEIREGQEVKIAIDAFPYQTFGMVQGQVLQVSQAAVTSNGSSAYIVEVRIPESIKAYGRDERILPGMKLTARIVAQERTLLQLLLDPLYAVAKR